MTEATETTRLHITPFTPDILPSVLPASVRNLATEVSFHEITTFPENNYGYVTLPKMEAEKIKKKLNGAMLKGKKFKVESARPQKRHRELEDPVPESDSTKKKTKKSKKQEPEDGVVEGFELPEGRKVKRGWTESNDAKQERRKSEKKGKKEKEAKLQPKSKYTDKSECLFRATIPPNRAADAAADDKKAKKKKSKDNVVHEFTKLTTQPSFLRTAQESVPPTVTFEEGKGWVDADGNLKEAANDKIKKDNKHPGQVAGAKEKHRATNCSDKKKRSRKEKTPEESTESEDYTSSSGSSSGESSDSDSESEDDDQAENASISSDSEEEKEENAEVVKQPAPQKEAEETPEASESEVEAETTPSDSKEATPEPTQAEDVPSKEVHPLEALFKRAAPAVSDDQPKAEPEAGFSFFGNDIESEDEQPEPQPPFTPFTKNDLQNRGQRSAAPTPDTAAATRHTKWNESEESDDASIDSPVKARTGDDNGETEFAKWFWENRGDNNRAWKKRRRDAAKEQRQRDNRKKGLKGRS
ncbi:unnamed protein product [Penicillium salamii]|uniref:Nucleotide-binding, alpha-beta plait n=1 Tax=Penicillium salamii TaxID=1612424 RepID=A0A9W4P1B9_9EURO|nr:unnamed protein product [Penicillium salamii]CAG8071766.1 unnamed protein product [Penicillium salamii]CAG8226373.1 unnamed protein product [Penicillium salamii]CAG8250068.1 unnamed protein product [Penicillium salamii]CAG8307622.1 unnamed protein product [Penicillium salamii]